MRIHPSMNPSKISSQEGQVCESSDATAIDIHRPQSRLFISFPESQLHKGSPLDLSKYQTPSQLSPPLPHTTRIAKAMPKPKKQNPKEEEKKQEDSRPPIVNNHTESSRSLL